MPIIYAEHDYGYGGCTDCGCCGVSVHVHESIADLIRSHPEVKKQLLQDGWVPLKEIKDTQDKATLEGKFYVADDPSKYNHRSYHVGVREVKIHSLEEWDINLLARGTTMLVQKVDPKSVLPDYVCKRMAEAAKWYKEAKKTKKKGKS